MGIEKVTNAGATPKNNLPTKPIATGKVVCSEISKSEFDRMQKLSSASTLSQAKASININKSSGSDLLKLQLQDLGAKTLELPADESENLEKKYRIDQLRDYLEKRVPQEHYLDPYFTCITSVPEQVFKEQGIDEYSKEFAKNLAETFDKKGLIISRDIIADISWLFDSQIELLTQEINSQIENIDKNSENDFSLDDFKIVDTTTNPFDSEKEGLSDVAMNKVFMRTYNGKLKQIYSIEQ